jgi:hypothetical protein
MKKSRIHQQFINGIFEVYFINKGTKFNFTGTSTNEDGHTFHEILNPATRVYKSVPHSVLSQVVDFDSEPILIK